MNMTPKQQQILEAVLGQVEKLGWTQAALEAVPGAKAVFPDVAAAVAGFQLSIDEAMRARINATRKFAAMRTRDKVAFALRARLEALEPHRDAARRLAVWYLLPRHLKAGADHLWEAADAVWLAAGDTATDYNRYTKRLLLIAVMKSTYAIWLADESEGGQQTWDFLDRRIEDVMRVGKGIAAAKAVGIDGIMSFVKARFIA
jgi:ubiquinone biosynthesis protein COQ9